MTAKEFEKKTKEIISLYPDVKVSDSSYQYKLDTIMGEWHFSLEYSPRIKVANAHTKFSEGFNLELFNKHIGEKVNRFSYKWNHYSQDPGYILDWIDETLNNFQYLNK